MKHHFLLCGSMGWGLEVLWTGLHSLWKGEPTLSGTSSLWMFPIYGMAAVIRPLSRRLGNVPFFFRGTLYMMGFYLVEFTTGSALRRIHACPWDYSGCRCHYKGLIRLDYAPLWFFIGLFYEKILCPDVPKSSL